MFPGFVPHYTTTVSTPHLQIRTVSKLLRTLYPAQDLRCANLLAYSVVRVVFFECAAARAFESLAQSTSRHGVVVETAQTHTMHKGVWNVSLNLHADVTTVLEIPGWNNRVSLYYDVSVAGMNNNGVGALRRIQGGLDVPEVFHTTHLVRSPAERQQFEAWAQSRQPQTVEKWHKAFGKMHTELASNTCVMFADMLGEPVVPDDEWSVE
jgi:hypothetical protein